MKKLLSALLCMLLCLMLCSGAMAQTVSFGMKNYEEIRWVVLSSNNQYTKLMSEECIACRPYDKTSSDWASSDLRKWLNTKYVYNTFSPDELDALCPVDNDLVRLPSVSDMLNTSYGFSSMKGAQDPRRAAQGNADAINGGLWTDYMGYCSYYTLTPCDAASMYQVRNDGSIGIARVDRDNVGVRVVIVVRTSALY